MKILNLKVEGFRSLRSIEWTPGDLNVVIGPNASGKSNLLSLLEMLAVSAQGALGKYVLSQGGIIPLVWDGRAERIAINVVTSPLSSNPDSNGLNVSYSLAMERLGTTSAYRIQNEFLKAVGPAGDTANRYIERDAGQFRSFEKENRGSPAESLARVVESGMDVPSTEESILSQFRRFGGSLWTETPMSLFRKTLESWGIYQSIDTRSEAPIRQAAVAQHETSLARDGSNLIRFLHTLYTGNRDFKDELNQAMAAAFGDDFDELLFPPVASSRIELHVRWKSLKNARPAADLSDGTLRFLYLIAILANPNPPGLIAIDEPEMGLHPSMLPIIAEYAVSAATRTQVILTTHSPELLDAFREEPPTTTVADLVNGETRLRVLSGDDLAYWLKEYTLGELYRQGKLERGE